MRSNPFNPDPLMDKSQVLIERDREFSNAKYYLISSSMFFLSGEQGVGKTFIARKLIEDLKKEYSIIYIDALKHSKNLDIEKVLIKSVSVFDKIKKRKSKLLIIDNLGFLTRRNVEKIKYYFDQNYVQSVMLIGAYENYSNLHPSIKNRIGERIIKLENIPVDKVYTIYASRIENPTMSSFDIEKIYKKTGFNLKKFITKLSSLHSDNPELEYMNNEEEKRNNTTCYKCGLKLENINHEWRCKKCDTYCTLCGEIVKENDLECPRCFAIFD